MHVTCSLRRTQRFERNRGEHLDPRRGLPYGQLHYTTIQPVFGGKGPLRLASVQTQTQMHSQTAPLVSYRYNSQGDLSEVTDEHGRSTRAPEFDTSPPFFAHFEGRPPYESIT